MTHTPGPWTAHAQASANNYVVLQENKWVAAIQFNGEYMEARQQEYAKWMAAAPAMLEALLAIKNGTEFWDDYPPDHPYGKARAAIAKAEA